MISNRSSNLIKFCVKSSSYIIKLRNIRDDDIDDCDLMDDFRVGMISEARGGKGARGKVARYL